ncbi:MAG: type III-B CRISPR module RAMP protein Cmr1 [Ktedonobacteraceae bacterium]|nr:type III-B CRISPR module RAMP protein Cmr1 [Ktedonobacteraceae bacterium]
MQRVTFTLRTLTPLFLAGADQTSAELRAPTFRGLMRYWQRALVGGIVGTDAAGLKTVIEQEKSVFGATDSGSAVNIQVPPIASHEPKEFTEPISRRIGNRWQATGKGYLLWSMAKSGRIEKGNFEPAHWYFPPGSDFQITLSSRDQNNMQLKQAIADLWLLTQLGAIGSRSRRGAGSVQVIETTLTDQVQISGISFQTANSIDNLQKQIENGLKAARNLYTSDLSEVQINTARFDILAPRTCRIWLLQEDRPWPNSEAAMQDLGKKLQDYRNQIPIEQRKIFGLPLLPIIHNKRRSSPLLLHIAKLQEDQYIAIAILFKTTGKGIKIEDYKLIEDWIDRFPGRLEVTL